MPGATILAIDDSPTILKVVQLVLSKAGYAVHTAPDGEEGLRLAQETRPDLILLDFVMPKMNGYQVCRALQESAGLREVPVVLMSAKGDQVGERFVKAMGIVDYITKPFSPEALTAVVSHTLAKYASKSSAEGAGEATTGETPLIDTDPGREGTAVDDEPADDDERTGRVRAIGPKTYPNLPFLSPTAKPEPAARPLDAVREAIARAMESDELLGEGVADLVRTRLPDEALAQVLAAIPGERTATGAENPLQTGAGPAEMVYPDEILAGDLARVPIAEVLSLLDQQRQTGILVLRRGEKRVEVFFKGGKVDFAAGEGLGDDFLLGNFILEREAMSRQDLELFFRSRGTSAKLCGEQLVKLNYITDEDLKQALSRQTCERIYEVLRWSSGRFSLHAVTDWVAPATRAALQLAVDGILMEGFRRIEEWHLIEREIDDFEAVFLRNEEAVQKLESGQLSRDEMAVLELVNAKNTVRDIVRQSRMSAFEVSQMLFRLRSIRLIRRRVQPVAV